MASFAVTSRGVSVDHSPGITSASLPATIEIFPSGATQYIFQASKFKIVADAVVDQFGNLVSGTDDTSGWLSLIAALPSDKAVIRLHGMSLVSGQLGFNMNDLTLIGDGPHTGFVLAHGSNTNTLRFNTTATNTGPPRLARVHLENFLVDHQGYYQTDPGSGIVGAVVAYAIDHFSATNVHVRRGKSVGINVVSCKEVDIGQPLIDTIVPGGAANGINCIGTTTATSAIHKIHDGHFVDVPDKPIDAGGIGAQHVAVSNNTVECRSIRPGVAGITGSPFIGFQSASTTATAWASGTDYAIGSHASNGGFNYVAMAASGPSNGGAVTPGTSQLVWWLQNAPAVWNSGTTYAVGQCVYYTAPTGSSGQVEGGTTLNFTCVTASTNNAPVTGGAVESHWQIGGPLTMAAQPTATVGCIGVEATPTPCTRDITVSGNVVTGTNAGGEYCIGTGIMASSSKSFPGRSVRSGTISGNTVRGTGSAAILANDENFNVTGNTVEDCTSGIQCGFSLSFTQRQWLVASNTIKLGGLGGGVGIIVNKNVSVYPLTNGLVDGNVIDGGMGPDMALTSALTGSSNYTSVSVDHVPVVLPTGTTVVIGKLPQGGGTIQAVVLSSPAAVGDTSLTVTSFTAAATFNAGTNLQIVPTVLTAALTNGTPTGTSVSITALVQAYQVGTTFTFPNSTGSTPQNVTLTAPAAIGDTSLTVASITPTATAAIGQPGGVWGKNGVAVSGQVTNSTIADNICSNLSLWGYVYTVATGTPSNIDQVDCWSYNNGGHTSVASTIPGLRLLNGGWLGCATAGSYSGTGSDYVLRRGVANINPGGSVSPPTFPATTVDVTNQSGFDVTVFVTNGTGAITQITIGGTATNMNIDASKWGAFRLPAGQKVNFTYGSGSPAWTWFAD